jgi:cytochrome c biogenesis protein CcmG/thiol:disulfide interchange protein DsbE
MVLDPKGSTAVSLGVTGVPESFLISPDGTIAAKIVGGLRYDQLEDLLDTLRNPSTDKEPNP